MWVGPLQFTVLVHRYAKTLLLHHSVGRLQLHLTLHPEVQQGRFVAQLGRVIAHLVPIALDRLHARGPIFVDALKLPIPEVHLGTLRKEDGGIVLRVQLEQHVQWFDHLTRLQPVLVEGEEAVGAIGLHGPARRDHVQKVACVGETLLIIQQEEEASVELHEGSLQSEKWVRETTLAASFV